MSMRYQKISSAMQTALVMGYEAGTAGNTADYPPVYSGNYELLLCWMYGFKKGNEDHWSFKHTLSKQQIGIFIPLARSLPPSVLH